MASAIHLGIGKICVAKCEEENNNNNNNNG
jgi:hypothetical protein